MAMEGYFSDRLHGGYPYRATPVEPLTSGLTTSSEARGNETHKT